MTHAVVLGCGMVGATIARDLARDERFRVTAADVQDANLRTLGAGRSNLTLVRSDLSSATTLKALIADADVVVGALPSAMGFATLQLVVAAGKRYCDISFMPEDALSLHETARRAGATAVVDCGVAPGLANVIIGDCAAELGALDEVVFYVGGLPKPRTWPYQYRAPFAPLDVLEEYTRPTRLVEHGQIVVRPALSDPELLDFPGVGTLEAFNTDGLRSLTTTIRVPSMREKTLRYPGHIELMRVLRETGYFSKDEIEVRGQRVRPIDVTARLLFPMWKAPPGEAEFTILRVIVRGRFNDAPVTRRYELFDETDPVTGESSMARTTGFPTAIIARMLALGEIPEPGVFVPEQLGMKKGLLDRMIAELAHRGVQVQGPFPDLNPP